MRSIFKNMALMLRKYRLWCQFNGFKPKKVNLINNQLTLYRFSSFIQLQQLLQDVRNISFYFIRYKDNSSNNWLWMSEPAKVLPELVKNVMTGEVLVIGQEFFAFQHIKFIGMAIKNMAEQKGPYLVTGHLQTQWQWIMGKIICTADCDYKFKHEYLQELTLHLVHFSLKNFAVRPSRLTDDEAKTLLVDSQPKGDEFMYSLYFNLNISAN